MGSVQQLEWKQPCLQFSCGVWLGHSNLHTYNALELVQCTTRRYHEWTKFFACRSSHVSQLLSPTVQGAFCYNRIHDAMLYVLIALDWIYNFGEDSKWLLTVAKIYPILWLGILDLLCTNKLWNELWKFEWHVLLRYDDGYAVEQVDTVSYAWVKISWEWMKLRCLECVTWGHDRWYLVGSTLQ